MLIRSEKIDVARVDIARDTLSHDVAQMGHSAEKLLVSPIFCSQPEYILFNQCNKL